MRVEDIEHIIEQWAPRWTAWEKDNVGLQVGDHRAAVRTVGVALDPSEAVVSEARRRKADLIVTHHPLFFRPPRTLTADHAVSRRAIELARAGIALYSAHTNLDAALNGVSMELARVLGLRDLKFLAPLEGQFVKLVIFAPRGYERQVLDALASGGAGEIGKYSHCSFQVPGNGTFLPLEGANPRIGERGRLESAEELRIEAVSPRASVREVIERVRAVHPYEEMAYDIVPVETPATNHGMGAVGDLARPTTLRAFLQRVRRSLGAGSLRYRGRPERTVRRVAVCGGSGSELIGHAASASADVFVTADVKYHAFLDAPDDLVVVDAGHAETERVIVEPLAARLRAEARRRGERISVYVSRAALNPVQSI